MIALTLSSQRLKETVTEMFGICLVFVAIAGVAHCGTGCQDARDSLSDPAHNYATEIIACAATAGYPSVYDRDADMRCRGKVDAKYGVGAYRDAGTDR